MLPTIWPSASLSARAFHPVRVGHELAPLLLALGKRLPGQEIGQLLVGFTDQRREEPGLLDAVLLPELQRDRLEPLQERRQAAGHAAIDAHFVDHSCSSLIRSAVITAGPDGVLGPPDCRPRRSAHG